MRLHIAGSVLTFRKSIRPWGLTLNLWCFFYYWNSITGIVSDIRRMSLARCDEWSHTSNTLTIPSLQDFTGVFALSSEAHTPRETRGMYREASYEQTLGYRIVFNLTKPNKPNQVLLVYQLCQLRQRCKYKLWIETFDILQSTNKDTVCTGSIAKSVLTVITDTTDPRPVVMVSFSL